MLAVADEEVSAGHHHDRDGYGQREAYENGHRDGSEVMNKRSLEA